MDAFVTTIVTVIQILLAGFLAWGGWLAFRGTRPAAAAEPGTQANDFERVASLVLFALLCTAVVAV